MRFPLNLLVFCFLLCFASSDILLAQQRLARVPLSSKTLDSLRMVRDFTGVVKRIGPSAPGSHVDFVQWRGRTAARKPGKRSDAMSVLTGRAEARYCYDTSSRFLLKTDNITYYIESVITTADGNLLMSGEHHQRQTARSSGMLIKADIYGNILWSKAYDTVGLRQGYGFLSFRQVIELRDHSFLVSGYTSNITTMNGDFVLMRVNGKGDILWNKVYASRAWQPGGTGSADYFPLRQLIQDSSTGYIYFTGNHWADGRNITKINPDDGSILWSKMYRPYQGYNFDQTFGMDITSDALISFGKSLTSDTYVSIYRIDKVSGDTLSTAYYKTDDTTGTKTSFLGTDQLKKLNNGHYIISGSVFGYYDYAWDGNTPLYQAAMAEFDQNLRFVRAYTIRNNIESNEYNTVTTVFPDGTGLFAMLHFISGYTADMYYVQFKDGQIIRQRRRRYAGEGLPIENEAIKLRDGGDLNIKLIGDSTDNVSKIEFLKLHVSDTSSACTGFDDYHTFFEPLKMRPAVYGLDSIPENDFHESQVKTLVAFDLSLDLLPGCKTVARCDTVHLAATKDTVCISDGIDFVVRKNPACGAQPFFSFDSSAIRSFERVNDSSFHIAFSSPWKGYIRASISSCIKVEDSMNVVVLPSPPAVSLGQDRTLCPGNILVLHAGTGYASYRWQDGSGDSVFTVRKPGKYYVAARNACGGISSDTVVVTAAGPIPFVLADTVSVCRGDSLQVETPAGFLTYQWSPSYRVNDIHAQEPFFSPLMDTTYHIRAEKTPGCFAYDSVHVHVVQSPPVALGPDTSFCAGQSLVLDAGPGFSGYQWNTGAGTQQIKVSAAGSYAVNAFFQGCSVSDTLVVQHVYPLPVFSLGPDDTLCAGERRNYAFDTDQAVYQWSTGSVLSSASIGVAGTYWLTVNAHGCIVSDTVHIAYKPLPVVSLGADTLLCEGTPRVLDASYPGATYTWQDGSTSPQYTVREEGVYTVQVLLDGCTASDSVRVGYLSLPSFTLGQDFFLCRGQSLRLTPAMNTAVAYRWQDGSLAPTYTVAAAGTYILTATNTCGSRTDSVVVTSGLCRLMLPSAFTPNVDGLNDLFRVKYIFPVKQFLMVVYNRWGQQVFTSSSIASGWNGTYLGLPAPSGSYVWYVKLVDNDGLSQSAQGTVTLMR